MPCTRQQCKRQTEQRQSLRPRRQPELTREFCHYNSFLLSMSLCYVCVCVVELGDWKTEKANRVRCSQFLTELPLNAWSSDFQDVDVVNGSVQVGRFLARGTGLAAGFQWREIQTSAGRVQALKGSIFSSERFLQGINYIKQYSPPPSMRSGTPRLPDQYAAL